MIGPIVRLTPVEKRDIAQAARQLHNATFLFDQHIRDDAARSLILDDLKDAELAIGRARKALGVSAQKPPRRVGGR